MWSLLGLSLMAAFATAASIAPRSIACNNSPSLCSKPYNTVVHLGAHDSPFVRDSTTDHSTSGNQYYNSTVQLDAGVRLLTAQVHKSNGEWRLCHSACDLLDVGTVVSWLTEIKTWMDMHPHEVVTILIVNSDSATRADLHAQFSKSNITSYAYTPESNIAIATWPTLQNLIDANTRLLTFVASLSDSGTPEGTEYLMDEFGYIFENSYDNVAFSDFSCEPKRPTGLTIETALASNRMSLINHFLYKEYNAIVSIQMPDVDNITTTNSPSVTTFGALGAAADKCTREFGSKLPTYFLVDFFDEGPAMDTVDRLNGLSTTVGRVALPPRDTGSSSQVDDSWAGVQALVEQVQNGEKPSRGAWIWGGGKWSWGGLNLSGGSIVS